MRMRASSAASLRRSGYPGWAARQSAGSPRRAPSSTKARAARMRTRSARREKRHSRNRLTALGSDKSAVAETEGSRAHGKSRHFWKRAARGAQLYMERRGGGKGGPKRGGVGLGG